MPLIVLFLNIILTFNIIDDVPPEKKQFIAPLKIPIALSANFGELRSNHFHSGLDIKTQGVKGIDVIASASGYVYRISVSPGGFGKALYLRHPSGYSTVYAHLDAFNSEIQDYVIENQYRNRSYLVNLYPSKEKFRYKQGDLIAFSGNTGSSTGPHLHYEIRKSQNENPINPLLFEFGIKDDFKPVIEKLVVYPIYGNSLVNNENKPLKLNVSGGHGNYYISSKNRITIIGAAGFGIKCYDLLNNSYNKCAVYSIELKIDTVKVFKYVMNSFSFYETRYLNSHIDYELFMREKFFIERTFLLPNDKFSAYQDLIGNGILNFSDCNKHNVMITVSDIHNNRSILSFNVFSSENDNISDKNEENDFIVMPYARNNKFISKNIMVNIPSGSLYDTILFDYKRSPAKNGMLSEIHHVHNIYTPLHKPYNLSIKPSTIPDGKEASMLIVHANGNGNIIPLNSRWENGFLTANPENFGTFYIGIDTIAPVIVPNYASGSNLKDKKEFRIRITDNLAGIKSYEPQIDGKWALFEYDQKNNLLIYKMDSKRIEKGIKHDLLLKVTDNKDNLNTYKYSFFW